MLVLILPVSRLLASLASQCFFSPLLASLVTSFLPLRAAAKGKLASSSKKGRSRILQSKRILSSRFSGFALRDKPSLLISRFCSYGAPLQSREGFFFLLCAAKLLLLPKRSSRREDIYTSYLNSSSRIA